MGRKYFSSPHWRKCDLPSFNQLQYTCILSDLWPIHWYILLGCRLMLTGVAYMCKLRTMMTLKHGKFSTLLAFCEGNPSGNGCLPQKARNAELWHFIYSLSWTGLFYNYGLFDVWAILSNCIPQTACGSNLSFISELSSHLVNHNWCEGMHGWIHSIPFFARISYLWIYSNFSYQSHVYW